MKLPYVFLHGWGFDASFWHPVCDLLGQERCILLDWGYFGSPFMTLPSEPFIAVGHSLGVMWFLQNMSAWCQGLVSINGFACFIRAESYSCGVSERVVGRMRRKIHIVPELVVQEFRSLCGAEPSPPGRCSAELLDRGLQLLQSARVPAKVKAPLRALAGQEDRVVTPDMTRASFGDAVDWVASAGHLLPLTHSALCAGFIQQGGETFGQRGTDS